MRKKERNERSVPIGAIIPMASHLEGSLSIESGEVKDGFMLCDGSDIPSWCILKGKTPKLNDSRFLMGTPTAGNEGGQNTHKLSVNELPSHNHNMNHDHKANSEVTGNHTHPIKHSHEGSSTAWHHHGMIGNVMLKQEGSEVWAFTRNQTNMSLRAIAVADGSVDGTNATSFSDFKTVDNTPPINIKAFSGSSEENGRHSHGIRVIETKKETANTGESAEYSTIPNYFSVTYVIRVM